MKTLVMIGALCFGLSATAQTTDSAQHVNTVPEPEPTRQMKHECIMAQHSDWKALGLDEEQITQVAQVQERCKKDGGTSGSMKQYHDADVLMKHQKEIEAILTSDQKMAWHKWCADQPATSTLPMKK